MFFARIMDEHLVWQWTPSSSPEWKVSFLWAVDVMESHRENCNIMDVLYEFSVEPAPGKAGMKLWNIFIFLSRKYDTCRAIYSRVSSSHIFSFPFDGGIVWSALCDTRSSFIRNKVWLLYLSTSCVITMEGTNSTWCTLGSFPSHKRTYADHCRVIIEITIR